MMLPWLLATKMRAAGERFDPGIGEPFRRGRERADIGGGDQARQIGMRDGAEQADAIREAEPDDQRIEPAAFGAVARDQQRRIGPAEPRLADDRMALALDNRDDPDATGAHPYHRVLRGRVSHSPEGEDAGRG